MSYYATTSGRETFARLSHLFFYIKQWWLHQPPRLNGIKTWRAFLFVLLIPSQKQEFSPPPLFLFANDVEIGNHFVFSVIMNIWCMPSAHVVVWWAWPWLLVQKKKRHINVQAGSGWAIFGKISDAQIFPSTGGGVLCEWILFVLLFGGLDITKKKKNEGLFGKAETNEAMLWCLYLVLASSPSEVYFLGHHKPIYLTNTTLYSHTVGSGQRDDDAGEREGWGVWET